MANLEDITNRSEVGTIKPWGKSSAPAGYVLCDGAAISRTDYVDLFTVVGTTYGAGNGSTTFNVPNLQGKMPQGYDGGSSYDMADTGGANTVTVSVTNNQAATNSITNNQSVTVTGSIDNTSLTTAQLASHLHPVQMVTESQVAPFVTAQLGSPGNILTSPASARQGYNPTVNTWMNNSGSGTGHNHSHTLSGTLTGTVAVTTALTGAVTAAGTNTFSPYVVVNYIIKH